MNQMGTVGETEHGSRGDEDAEWTLGEDSTMSNSFSTDNAWENSSQNHVCGDSGISVLEPSTSEDELRPVWSDYPVAGRDDDLDEDERYFLEDDDDESGDDDSDLDSDYDDDFDDEDDEEFDEDLDSDDEDF